MQKLAFLMVLSLYGHFLSGQDRTPVIKSNSSTVDIRVGDDYFSKGGWVLEPEKNPDVFSIGSKWPYTYKKVSFITDIDSISFDVQPGNKYNFIILLDETQPCHIQIVTSPNPVFLNSKILIPIGLGFTLLILLMYLKRNVIKAVYLIKLGYVIPLLFWMTTFVSGYIHGNYNHEKNVISELGAIGTPSESITSASLILLAILDVLFLIGFYRASRNLKLSPAPALLSFSQPVALTWAAVFPLGNEFHSLTGPLPLLVILASFLGFLLWRGRKEFFLLRALSLLSFFIMALILLRFTRPFGVEYEGLVQRFFYLGWTVWMVAISYFLSRQLKVCFEN